MKKNILIFCLGSVLLAGCGFGSVGPGERAVFARFGVVDEKCYQEGFYFYNPFTTSWYEVDAKLQKHTVYLVPDEKSRKHKTYGGAGSKDLQDVYLIVGLNYRASGEKCHTLIRVIGPDFVDRLVEPQTVEAAKAAVGTFDAEHMIQKRPELKKIIETSLRERLSGYSIEVDSVILESIDFHPAYAKAIEEKQIEQQKVMQKEYERQQAVKEAETRVARATGESESNKLLRASLSPEVLQFEALRRWNGVLPQVTGPSTPFVNLK